MSLSMEPVLNAADDIIQAGRQDDRPFLAVPDLATKTAGDLRVKFYSLRDVNTIIDRAARLLVQRGLRHVDLEACQDPPVAAILGTSNLEFLMTSCALSRLGYTVLIFSPRLAPPAYASLLQTTGCSILLNTPQHSATVTQIRRSLQPSDLQTFPLLSRHELFQDQNGLPSLEIPPSSPQMTSKTAFIIHSSGSTGTPKPIFLTHRRYITNSKNTFKFSVLMTMPLYHAFGAGSFYLAVASRKMYVLHDWSQPLTAENIIKVAETLRPGFISLVPYTLKLLAESEKGVKVLADCDHVTYHGSTCPDELGNKLVEHGVNLVCHFGSTEVGLVGTSARPADDKTWNYIRFLPLLKPHVQMKEVSPGIFEMIVLEGLPTLNATNSDDPPNSFHTRDLWQPHPTRPDLWKPVGRLDDRVTLLNGEKVLPLPIEGCIRACAFVEEAVVFGVNREVPGVLLFRARQAAEMAEDEFLAAVMPYIERANQGAEGFSQISGEMVVVAPYGEEFPKTDKGSIMRALGYSRFSDLIDERYQQLESGSTGKLEFDYLQLQEYLLRLCRERFNLEVASADADLFSAGLDSLRAIQMSFVVNKELLRSPNAEKLGQSIVYRLGTVEKIAGWLLHQGSEGPDGVTDNDLLEGLIQKYSKFTRRSETEAEVPDTSRQTIIVTGATGSLGGHIVHCMAALPQISKIICLVRSTGDTTPQKRLLSALHSRNLDSPSVITKTTAHAADLSLPTLGLAPSTLDQITQNLTLIIHCAWPVNFNASILSFEPHIHGVQNLLNLSLAVPYAKPAQFLFCSSISVASRAPSAQRRRVPEALIEELGWAQVTGYGQSKMVAEHVVGKSREVGARAGVLRIGQIVGAKEGGGEGVGWNDSEFIPLIIRSALTLKALPKLPETCAWLPVDLLATAISEIATAAATTPLPPVLNLVNPTAFDWTADLLPAIRDAGIDFEAIEPSEWVRKLRAYDGDAEANPAVKLLEWFELRYEEGRKRESVEVGLETTKAREVSKMMRGMPDCVREGYVRVFVGEWLRKWRGVARG